MSDDATFPGEDELAVDPANLTNPVTELRRGLDTAQRALDTLAARGGAGGQGEAAA